MLQRFRHLGQTARNHWRFVAFFSVGFLFLYYGTQLLAMVIKFGQFPNYMKGYDWLSNVRVIIESTPSWRDTLAIIKAEWLLELGYMNYDFGFGIAQWSLYIAPVKALAVMLLGAMLALLWVLLRRPAQVCETRKTPCAIAGGVGAAMASLSLLSLSWVVCCATPSWVVGLAILGLSASTSLMLEPAGIWLNSFGFFSLALVLFVAATPLKPLPKKSTAKSTAVPISPREQTI